MAGYGFDQTVYDMMRYWGDIDMARMDANARYLLQELFELWNTAPRQHWLPMYVMLVLVNELNFSTQARLAVSGEYRISIVAYPFYIIHIHQLLR